MRLIIFGFILVGLLGAVYVTALQDGNTVADLGSQLSHFIDKVRTSWRGTPSPTTPATTLSPSTAPLPASFTSGDSRFSQGNCTTATDCKVSGCSGEVCGRSEVISTCEFSDDFPNVQGLSCGCVRGKCGWAK